VIGLLRFVGLINAAVWFATILLVALAVEPAATSQDMIDLLSQRNFPYFSVAISYVIIGRFVHLYLLCSVIALAHLTAEWLYLGKYPHRLWVALVVCLALIGVLENYWLLPKLKAWHYLRSGPQARNQMADRSYQYGHMLFEGINLLAVGGLGLYLWRVAYPPEPARFVSTSKFRG
jgi:hypothetical protein